jgi:hypothetical protein
VDEGRQRGIVGDIPAVTGLLIQVKPLDIGIEAQEGFDFRLNLGAWLARVLRSDVADQSNSGSARSWKDRGVVRIHVISRAAVRIDDSYDRRPLPGGDQAIPFIKARSVGIEVCGDPQRKSRLAG